MLQALVQHNEGVLDTVCGLDLVTGRLLPGFEGLEGVQEQRWKVLGKLIKHVGKGWICSNLLADALKCLKQCDG